MADERDEWNDDIARIRDGLQRNLAQGHKDLADDARRRGDREEDIAHLAEVGWIFAQERPLTISEKIIYAPSLVKVGCAMAALGLCGIATYIITK